MLLLLVMLIAVAALLSRHAGAVGLVVIVIAQHGLHLTDLMALGMGLSNTFGLAAGILLMGYGLVEIPRHLWKSDPEQLLKWCAHRSASHATVIRLLAVDVSSTAQLLFTVR